MRPLVLAPVGDPQTLRVALAAGADAVYLGLDDGFNARARAHNFDLAGLADVAAQVHLAGAQLYITLNTLVFDVELEAAEHILREVARAGADAIIVQDPAICLLARALCPELEVHASTQMTVSSAGGARFAEGLGVTRIVVPRELSVEEIATLRASTELELEVFVHGALCMSWSGQCLTSEAWGGRSANRGQCAQSCRLPYDLVVDGERRELGEVRYLLSPRDLAGYDAVPALAAIGVHTLKIEGRLKGPAYVATAVGGLHRWLDAVDEGVTDDPQARAALGKDLLQMGLSYSRGLSPGFLGGVDHQRLVDGRFPKSRGAPLGLVVEVGRSTVRVVRDPSVGADEVAVAPVELRAGMGVVFDRGDPRDTAEPGGPLFGVEREADGWVLRFGRSIGPDLSRVRPGHRVWVTSDPAIARDAERLGERPLEGRVAVRLRVSGRIGEPLRVEAVAGAACAERATDALLVAAERGGLDRALLQEKLGAFGGTPLRLDALDVDLPEGLYLPPAQLKRVRRALVDALVPAIARGSRRAVVESSVRASLVAELTSRWAPRGVPGSEAPRVVPLCRTDAQLDAVLAAGVDEVELDWMELVGLGRAVARARAAGVRVTVATVRVQKPGEQGYDARLARLAPDAVLARHWGAVMDFAALPVHERPLVHGDFSLNVTNALTARHLLALGLDTLTAAHDLDETQLFALLEGVPADRLTVVVHHHVPTFHTEHCVYAAHLSEGRDYRTCGRPCEAHRVALRDPIGHEHPVIVDVGCRNTVFNAAAQSAASLVPRLLAAGVKRYRIELVWESAEETARVLAAYRDLLAGRATPADAVARVGVHEQFGVTAGTMSVLRSEGPRAG
jgi:putative protease